MAVEVNRVFEDFLETVILNWIATGANGGKIGFVRKNSNYYSAIGHALKLDATRPQSRFALRRDARPIPFLPLHPLTAVRHELFFTIRRDVCWMV